MRYLDSNATQCRGNRPVGRHEKLIGNEGWNALGFKASANDLRFDWFDELSARYKQEWGLTIELSGRYGM